MRSLMIISLLLALFSFNAWATNNDENLDEVCSLSSGKWHTSASGWACCWANWGCYGCTGGNCGMTCRTPKCKKANEMAKLDSTHQEIQGLAPTGMKLPVVPKHVKLPSRPAAPKNEKLQ